MTEANTILVDINHNKKLNNGTLLEELFRLQLFDDMNSGHALFEVIFGVILLLLGFIMGFQLLEKRKFFHLIGNGVPLFYWSLFLLNFFFRSGSNDFMCCMRAGRPQINGFVFLGLLLVAALTIAVFLQILYQKWRRASNTLMTFFSCSVLLTLLCNSSIHYLRLMVKNEIFSSKLDILMPSLIFGLSILFALLILYICKNNKLRLYRLMRLNCALLGSYFIIRGFVYITHDPVDHHMDLVNNTGTKYLILNIGLFAIALTFSTCRDKMSEGGRDNPHGLAGCDDEDDNLMIEIDGVGSDVGTSLSLL